MTFRTAEKIGYGATLAATILAGAGVGTVIAGSTLAITAGAALGATAGLIGIIFHRILIADRAEKELSRIHEMQPYASRYEPVKALADQGYRNAEHYAGVLISVNKSIGNTTRIRTSLDYYKRAADKGHLEAQMEVGDICSPLRNEVCKDKDLAMKYYKLAADQGKSFAMYNLGVLYEENKDYPNALKWYRLGSDNGCVFSHIKMGDVFYDGKCGVTKDFKKALHHYETASKSKEFMPFLNKGMYSKVAQIYREGLGGVPQNAVKASEWQQQANILNHIPG